MSNSREGDAARGRATDGAAAGGRSALLPIAKKDIVFDDLGTAPGAAAPDGYHPSERSIRRSDRARHKFEASVDALEATGSREGPDRAGRGVGGSGVVHERVVSEGLPSVDDEGGAERPLGRDSADSPSVDAVLSHITIGTVYPFGLDWKWRPVGVTEDDYPYSLEAIKEERAELRGKVAAGRGAAAVAAAAAAGDGGVGNAEGVLGATADRLEHLTRLEQLLRKGLEHWLVGKVSTSSTVQGAGLSDSEVRENRLSEEKRRLLARKEWAAREDVRRRYQQLADELDEEAVVEAALEARKSAGATRSDVDALTSGAFFTTITVEEDAGGSHTAVRDALLADVREYRERLRLQAQGLPVPEPVELGDCSRTPGSDASSTAASTLTSEPEELDKEAEVDKSGKGKVGVAPRESKLHAGQRGAKSHRHVGTRSMTGLVEELEIEHLTTGDVAMLQALGSPARRGSVGSSEERDIGKKSAKSFEFGGGLPGNSSGAPDSTLLEGAPSVAGGLEVVSELPAVSGSAGVKLAGVGAASEDAASEPATSSRTAVAESAIDFIEVDDVDDVDGSVDEDDEDNEDGGAAVQTERDPDGKRRSLRKPSDAAERQMHRLLSQLQDELMYAEIVKRRLFATANRRGSTGMINVHIWRSPPEPPALHRTVQSEDGTSTSPTVLSRSLPARAITSHVDESTRGKPREEPKVGAKTVPMPVSADADTSAGNGGVVEAAGGADGPTSAEDPAGGHAKDERGEKETVANEASGMSSRPQTEASPGGGAGAKGAVSAAGSSRPPVAIRGGAPEAEASASGSVRLEFIRLLGRGAAGKVFLGRLVHYPTGVDPRNVPREREAEMGVSGELIAVKQFASRGAPTAGLEQVLRVEADLLSRLSHPHVIRYRGLHYSRRRKCHHMMMEYAEGGTLATLMKKYPTGLPEARVAHLVSQLLTGIAYLHRQRIIHRDLKPANLLLTGDGQLKIADFDVATQVVGLRANERSCVGTPWYTAPEVIEVAPYSFGADIWSVGCVVLELATGSRPWSDCNGVQALFKMVEEPHPPLPVSPRLSAELAEFLLKCFHRNADTRATAADLLAHRFLKKHGLQASIRPTQTRRASAGLPSQGGGGNSAKSVATSSGGAGGAEDAGTPSAAEKAELTLASKRAGVDPSAVLSADGSLDLDSVQQLLLSTQRYPSRAAAEKDEANRV